jgi:hypothetical protein
MERITDKAWRNFDPWECCGQDKYCQRGCHEEGGCNNGCIVNDVKGYDDRYFHDEVLPSWYCPKCKKSRNDLGIVGEPTETKYPEGFQV